MQYRPLGNTGMNVSCIGLGCGQLGAPDPEHAVRLVQRALELGVNYFDTARGYWDSEVKIGQALKVCREKVYVSTKTGARSKEDAWRSLLESLERLQTGYLDNVHLHGLSAGEDMDVRLGRGGALEALIEAREQGLVRHIGFSSHSYLAAIEALGRFDFEIVLIIFNYVEREPLQELIPLCQRKGIGFTVMKPVATGLLPARSALKWVLNQPIACAVPGAETLAQVEENCAVGQLTDTRLSPAEEAEVLRVAGELANVRCRSCSLCEPCPQKLWLSGVLGSDIVGNYYRNMDPAEFRRYPWSREMLISGIQDRQALLAKLRNCDHCRECERKCPYGLPIVAMLEAMIQPTEETLRIWGELLEQMPGS
jgi:uncharacterized protein